jgi:hypothetical protein
MLNVDGGPVTRGGASMRSGGIASLSPFMIQACSSRRPSVSISMPTRSATTWYAADTRAPRG